MVVDARTRTEIEKQERLYDATKKRIISRIQNNIKMAIEKLKTAENELIEEVEAEFGENPFAALTTKIESENPPTDEEVKSVLERGIPQDLWPNEESFFSLCREIEAFKEWRAKKEVKPCIAAPSNVRVESTTEDSITLAWNDDWRASSYQIEVDGGKSLDRVTTNTFTKGGLPAGTEHSFRVRTIKGYEIGEWSAAAKGKTRKAHDFSESIWKECPGYVDVKRKYSVHKNNSRIATKINVEDGWCTIIGNTFLPPNQVTSWCIKILRSRDNDGWGIIIGVAPSDINQNENENFNKCGWYFDCFNSTLHSQPPHNYKWKPYGIRKADAQYVHNGDCVCVVMDTAKGELSFAVNGVNLGVAYKGIPLSKPLVPCVILFRPGDSVELVI